MGRLRIRTLSAGRRLVATLLVAGAAACGADDSGPQPATSPGAGARAGEGSGSAEKSSGAEQDLVQRGKRIYDVNCIACHNRDPSQGGGLGPAVAGSSYELLEARVLRAEYPPGYTPKQETRLMVPLPHLEPEIDALAAYLGSIPE